MDTPLLYASPLHRPLNPSLTSCSKSTLSTVPISAPGNASVPHPLTSTLGHTSAKLSLKQALWTRRWPTLPLHQYLGTPLFDSLHIDTRTRFFQVAIKEGCLHPLNRHLETPLLYAPHTSTPRRAYFLHSHLHRYLDTPLLS